MGCKSCGTVDNGMPKGCKNNGTCSSGGCDKLAVYDWLANMELPGNAPVFEYVEVRFKNTRKDFYLNATHHALNMGDAVVVEGSPGTDLGMVSAAGELARLQMNKMGVSTKSPAEDGGKKSVKYARELKKVLHKATEADLALWKEARSREKETMQQARSMADHLGLEMKISDVDYQGDKTKATFYYTAEGRVDFRELIKKMAESFRIRIEMRQIGMRQEASRLGGIGSCGRELCCSTWLTDFKTVSTSAARYQNLSLNTLKLAGQCGKLKCCLNYELDSYMDALRDIPNNVDRIETANGIAFLQKTDIFKKLMWFSHPGEENWIAIPAERVKEIKKLNEAGEKPVERGIELEESVVEKEVSFDYENVVGQESITRLDEKNKKRKKSRNSRKKNAPEGAAAKADASAAAPSAGSQPSRRRKPAARAGDKPAGNAGDKPAAKPTARTGDRPAPKAGGRPAPKKQELNPDGTPKPQARRGRGRPSQNRGNSNNNDAGTGI